MGLRPIILQRGQAHLWRHALDVRGGQLAALGELLAADERLRAKALRVRAAQERFIIGRGLLRETLGRYRGEHPASLRFWYGPYGKPALVAEPAEGLHFNLAHADDLLLIVVAQGYRVGLDVERVRPIAGADQIAASLYSTSERAALAQAAPAQREALFAQIWTRHEALAKAEGGGLGREPVRSSSWFTCELSFAGNYVGTLALEGSRWVRGNWPSVADEEAPYETFTHL